MFKEFGRIKKYVNLKLKSETENELDIRSEDYKPRDFSNMGIRRDLK